MTRTTQLLLWALLALLLAAISGCRPAENPLALPADRPALLFFYTDN